MTTMFGFLSWALAAIGIAAIDVATASAAPSVLNDRDQLIATFSLVFLEPNITNFGS
jgi:hypothetical protein